MGMMMSQELNWNWLRDGGSITTRTKMDQGLWLTITSPTIMLTIRLVSGLSSTGQAVRAKKKRRWLKNRLLIGGSTILQSQSKGYCSVAQLQQREEIPVVEDEHRHPQAHRLWWDHICLIISHVSIVHSLPRCITSEILSMIACAHSFSLINCYTDWK